MLHLVVLYLVLLLVFLLWERLAHIASIRTPFLVAYNVKVKLDKAVLVLNSRDQRLFVLGIVCTFFNILFFHSDLINFISLLFSVAVVIASFLYTLMIPKPDDLSRSMAFLFERSSATKGEPKPILKDGPEMAKRTVEIYFKSWEFFTKAGIMASFEYHSKQETLFYLVRQLKGIRNLKDGAEPATSSIRLQVTQRVYRQYLVFVIFLLPSLSFIVYYGSKLGFFIFSHDISKSFTDCIYFIAVLISTVGFGDISPVNDAAKIFVIFVVILTITLISVLIGHFTGALDQRFRNVSNILATRHAEKEAELDWLIDVVQFDSISMEMKKLIRYFEVLENDQRSHYRGNRYKEILERVAAGQWSK